MLPNFGYGRQIMPTDVKKQGLSQMSANRPNIGSTGDTSSLLRCTYFHVTLDTSSLLRCTYFHVTLDTSSLLRCTYFHVTLHMSSLLRCTYCHVTLHTSSLLRCTYFHVTLRTSSLFRCTYFHVTLDTSSLLRCTYFHVTLHCIRLLYFVAQTIKTMTWTKTTEAGARWSCTLGSIKNDCFTTVGAKKCLLNTSNFCHEFWGSQTCIF